MSDFKKVIEQHLEKMAVADKSFAERYADKSKNIDACVDYIRDKARKQASSGMAAIEDSIVFGWAAHYYQEADLKEKSNELDDDKTEISCNVTIGKKRKAEKKQSNCLELDLFGGTL